MAEADSSFENGFIHLVCGPFRISQAVKVNSGSEFWGSLGKYGKLQPGVHLHILADAERPFENGYLLLDRGTFRISQDVKVNSGLEFPVIITGKLEYQACDK